MIGTNRVVVRVLRGRVLVGKTLRSGQPSGRKLLAQSGRSHDVDFIYFFYLFF